MNRYIARAVHETTNATYWAENSDWNVDNAIGEFVLQAFRKMPFSIHELQKRALFSTPDLIAVSGESVVVGNGKDEVDKFMFRFPGTMSIDDFYEDVRYETFTVVSRLTGIALETAVDVKMADIFRFPLTPAEAVTQTQPRVDLVLNPPLDLRTVTEEPHSLQTDRTARDVEKILAGADRLMRDDEFIPDVAYNSQNVRRNLASGSLTLLDVMPFHTDGTRLIGDKSPKFPAPAARHLQPYRDFAGRYGA